MTLRIDIIDRALIRVGALPLQTETARGASLRIAEYDGIVADLLSHPWSFGQRKRALTRLSGAPELHWAYRYALPTDMIGPPRAVFDSSDARVPFTDYELVASADATRPAELHTSAETVWLQYACNVAPQFWPAYFAEMAVLAVAAEFALSVREDVQLRDRLRREVHGDAQMPGAGGKLAEAKLKDAQGKPSARIGVSGNPLIDVRR